MVKHLHFNRHKLVFIVNPSQKGSQSDWRETAATSTIASFDSPKEATIFTIPENSSFYRRRRYADLDPTQQQIRLLKVHPRRLTLAEILAVYPQWKDKEGIVYFIGPPSITNPDSFPQPSFDLPFSIIEKSSFKSIQRHPSLLQGEDVYNKP